MLARLLLLLLLEAEIFMAADYAQGQGSGQVAILLPRHDGHDADRQAAGMGRRRRRSVTRQQFPDMKFDLYFLSTLPANEKYELEPGSDAAHRYLWTMKGTTLELTHNYGTETDEAFKYHPGNQVAAESLASPDEAQERDGFGHVAFNCND
ncbi:hypothetical protein GUITHDRAFT_149019, partial [Guillardia theta CCMP2712]